MIYTLLTNQLTIHLLSTLPPPYGYHHHSTVCLLLFTLATCVQSQIAITMHMCVYKQEQSM